jgi:hypothetical protein
MFNCRCKSKIISEVVNVCVMMFSVLYFLQQQKKTGRCYYSAPPPPHENATFGFWTVLVRCNYTMCNMWRFTGIWRKLTWKERKACTGKTYFMCVLVLWLFRKQLYVTIRGCKIYFIEQFCFCVIYWYGGAFVTFLTSAMISRNWGSVICFQLT